MSDSVVKWPFTALVDQCLRYWEMSSDVRLGWRPRELPHRYVHDGEGDSDGDFARVLRCISACVGIMKAERNLERRSTES